MINKFSNRIAFFEKIYYFKSKAQLKTRLQKLSARADESSFEEV